MQNSNVLNIDSSKIDPSKINGLTEVENAWKLFNMNLVDFYSGLSPAGLAKLSYILFSCILYNKMYKKADAKDYNEHEAKRIYTSILVQPKDLAKRINPAKYADGEKDIETDISNILKNISTLEDMNIFYVWKYKLPYTFIFVMERDVTSWKYYNPKGVIYPKSLKKIIRLAKGMIDSMESLEKQRKRIPDRSDIEYSFGEFINKLIDKMSPEISGKLPKWKEGLNIFTYNSNLMGELKKLNDYEGYVYDDLFIKRLPEHVRKKIVKSHKELSMINEELESEIVPANGNIVKLRGKKLSGQNKATKQEKVTDKEEEIEESLLANEMSFKTLDPFANPTAFTKYYRTFLRLYNKDIKFYDFAAEVVIAAGIMDLMTLSGRCEDLRFLKAWLRFYAQNHLKGNNIYKLDKTSIKAFKDTFKSYSQIYIG